MRNGFELETTKLTTQGLVIKAISQYTDKKHATNWHETLSTFRTTIYSFAICYLNNTLANKTNLRKWELKSSEKCNLVDRNQT